MQIQRIDQNHFTRWRRQIERLMNNSVRLNFPDFSVEDSYGFQRCNEVASYLENGTAIVYAAVEEENLLGWIWCHEIHRLGRKRLHIAEIAVMDEYQGQGIGQRLLAQIECFAAEHGYHEVDLLVTASNVNAVHFYEKSGFSSERYLMMKSGIRNPGSEE